MHRLFTNIIIYSLLLNAEATTHHINIFQNSTIKELWIFIEIFFIKAKKKIHALNLTVYVCIKAAYGINRSYIIFDNVPTMLHGTDLFHWTYPQNEIQKTCHFKRTQTHIERERPKQMLIHTCSFVHSWRAYIECENERVKSESQ